LNSFKIVKPEEWRMWRWEEGGEFEILIPRLLKRRRIEKLIYFNDFL